MTTQRLKSFLKKQAPASTSTSCAQGHAPRSQPCQHRNIKAGETRERDYAARVLRHAQRPRPYTTFQVAYCGTCTTHHLHHTIKYHTYNITNHHRPTRSATGHRHPSKARNPERS